MALTVKELELVYLGASIAAGCKPCTSFHFRKVKEVGASEEEIKNVILDSVIIRDSAKKEMKNYASNLLGILTTSKVNIDNQDPNRLTVVVSISAAFTVNCTTTLNNYLAFRESVGITNEDINKIFRSTLFIKRKAASHVDKIASRFEHAKSNGGDKEKSDDCGCAGITNSNDQKKSNDLDANVENDCC